MVSIQKTLITAALVAIPALAAEQSIPTALTNTGFRESKAPVHLSGDTGAASETIRRPLSPEMRGDIMMARKMYREAIEIYRELPGDSAVMLNKVGIAYHQMLELEMARRSYESAVKKDPKYSEAINNLGTVYYARKNYRKAVSQYRKALVLNPQSASVYSNLGTAEFARKRYKEAMEAYDHALKLDPEVFERRSANGVLLQERSVTERAKFHFFLARTYAKAGEFERALLYVRKSLEEGFKEREKYRDDPAFVQLQDNAEFQQLLISEPRVL